MNSDTIECSASSSKTMSNIIGTLISFTKHSGEEQITVLELGDNISETELMFS